jgi:hypothetical protein
MFAPPPSRPKVSTPPLGRGTTLPRAREATIPLKEPSGEGGPGSTRVGRWMKV